MGFPKGLVVGCPIVIFADLFLPDDAIIMVQYTEEGDFQTELVKCDFQRGKTLVHVSRP